MCNWCREMFDLDENQVSRGQDGDRMVYVYFAICPYCKKRKKVWHIKDGEIQPVVYE